MRSSDCRRSMSAISAVVVPPASSSMISWIRIFIKPPCVPVDCRQCLESLIDRAPARLSESSVGENVARFGPKSLVAQVVIQQFLNLMERPAWATALQPVGIRRWAIELFVRRISRAARHASGWAIGTRLRDSILQSISHGTNKLYWYRKVSLISNINAASGRSTPPASASSIARAGSPNCQPRI